MLRDFFLSSSSFINSQATFKMRHRYRHENRLKNNNK